MVEAIRRARSRQARLPLREVVTSGALLAVSTVAGLAIAEMNLGGKLSSPVASSELVLFVVGVVALVTLRVRSLALLGDAGPGVQIAALVLALAFLFGLLAAPPAQISGHESTIAILFGLVVVAFLVGAVGGVAIWRVRRATVVVSRRADLLRNPFARLLMGAVLGAALLNLATGSIPLLSSNIDAVRLGSSEGIFGSIWTWLIGGLEWTIVVAGVRYFALGRADRYSTAAAVVSTAILVLLAGRSFLVVVVLALVVAFASLRKLRLSWLAAVIVIGLLALGAAGKYRAEHSAFAGEDPQGSSSYGLISKSAGTGPAVFASVLERVPQYVPYQHGAFVIRDLRAMFPLHLFGRAESGDFWVTRYIRGRDVSVVGGSPPTLAGSLYIDFGALGVAVGAGLLGLLLTLLYRFMLRAQTVGATTLYGYLSAYVALSAYSYISIKPAVLAATLLSVGLHAAERRRLKTYLVASREV
jgi:oligosaccharide repeat unit polymerase